MSYTKKLLVSSALTLVSFSHVVVGSSREDALPLSTLPSLPHMAVVGDPISKRGDKQKLLELKLLEMYVPAIKKNLGYAPTPPSVWNMGSLFVTSLWKDLPRKNRLLQNTSDDDWFNILMKFGVTNKEKLDRFESQLTAVLNTDWSKVPDAYWVKFSNKSLLELLGQEDFKSMVIVAQGLEQHKTQGVSEAATEQSIGDYISNAITKIVEFGINNPLDATTLVVSPLLGWNVTDSPLVILPMHIVNSLKNAQMGWSLLNDGISNRGLVEFLGCGLAFYTFASLLPVAEAFSPTLGAQFPVSANYGTLSSIASLLGANGAPNGQLVGIWSTGSSGDVKGRIFFPNGTMVTNEFQVNIATSTIEDPYPVVAALPNGFVVGWSGDDLSIFARSYYNDGTVATAPFPVQQSTTEYTYFSSRSVGNLNGTALFAWSGAISVGFGDSYGFDTLIRSFSFNGTPLTDQRKVSQALLDGGPSVISQTTGGALVTFLSGPIPPVTYYKLTYKLKGLFIGSNGYPSGNEFIINQTATRTPSTGVGLANNNIAVFYSTSPTPFNYTSNMVGRIISSPTSIGSEFSILRGGTQEYDNIPSASLMPNGGFFVTWSGYQGENFQGQAFDSTGIPITDSFSISSLTPWRSTISVAGLPNNKVSVLFQDAETLQIWSREIDFSDIAPTPAPIPVPTPTPASIPVLTPTPAPIPVLTPIPAPIPIPTPTTVAEELTPSSWNWNTASVVGVTLPIAAASYLAGWYCAKRSNANFARESLVREGEANFNIEFGVFEDSDE